MSTLRLRQAVRNLSMVVIVLAYSTIVSKFVARDAPFNNCCISILVREVAPGQVLYSSHHNFSDSFQCWLVWYSVPNFHNMKINSNADLFLCPQNKLIKMSSFTVLEISKKNLIDEFSGQSENSCSNFAQDNILPREFSAWKQSVNITIHLSIFRYDKIWCANKFSFKNHTWLCCANIKTVVASHFI